MAIFNDTERMPRVLLLIGLWVVIMIITRVIFPRIRKPGHSLHIRFLDHAIRLVIYIFCIVNIIEIFLPGMNISSIFLRGSALIVAIVGFAAQPVISDLICGFLISFNKPFEIGDRIIVEGLEPGIVEDITLRHTVLRIYDDIRIIVPNSQLNSKMVTNTSYKQENRGVHLQYSVSYDTDVQHAMDIIRDCVAESPYTVGVENHGITEDSGPVYFLRYAESAIILETTIHVLPSVSTYTATTDINLRVHRAFARNHIEIPYSYINVIKKKSSEIQISEYTENTARDTSVKSPSKRNYRTDTAKLYGKREPVAAATSTALQFAERQRLSSADSNHLQLMSEELVVMLRDILADTRSTFYIEGSGLLYRMHLHIPISIDSDGYHTLLSLSSSGRNDAATDLGSRIREIMLTGLDRLRKSDSDTEDIEDFNWEIDEPDREQMNSVSKSILTTYADDIKVSIDKDRTDIVVEKSITR